MHRKSAFAITVALLGLAGCGDTSSPSTAEQPPLVTVAAPIVKEIVEYDDFTGRFEAVESVDVRARVNGHIEQVAFKDGALVLKGDLLVTIDKRPYQMAVGQAEAAVLAAQSRLKFADGDLERAQSLSRTGNLSEQTLEQRRQASSTARAELEGAQAALAVARLNLEWTEVRAPISGRVGRRLISQGNLVKADDSILAMIISDDPIHFYFDIDERSYLAYQRAFMAQGGVTNASSNARIAIFGDKEPTREARLDYLDNRVDGGSGNVRLRAVVANTDHLLKPGLFGTIKLAGSPAYQGVLVPDQAIATDQDRRFVWVVANDNTVSTRDVRPGPRIDGYRLIRTGLNGGETIVVSGLQKVKANDKVRVTTQPLAPVLEAGAKSPPRS